MTDIRPARFPEDLDPVVRIFREYVASPTVSLDFQDFETEFAALPGKYAAPEGCGPGKTASPWAAQPCARWMRRQAK
jgi:hypothetical protein